MSPIEQAVSLVDAQLAKLFSGLVAIAGQVHPAAAAVLGPVAEDVRRYAREQLAAALSREVEVDVEVATVAIKRRPKKQG